MPDSHTILSCARSWIGTRFHHQGRLKKNNAHRGGVDCLGLLVGIARELELMDCCGLPLFLADETDYSHQPDHVRLKQRLCHLLQDLPKEQVSPGNVVLLRIDDTPQHLAIISDFQDGLGLIHAYAPARAVVEHALNQWWLERIDAVYRVSAF